jgi:DNA-binding MarR family transcriptional regulator
VPTKHQPQPKDFDIATTRHAAVDEVIAGYEALMQRLADTHAPEFLEIAVSMPQAKLLYLLGALGDLHMSDLVHRLGVSLSTISGLVDRIVDQGLAARREDPEDRRQVVVALTPAGASFIDRFRELNARQMRELLELVGDDDLELIRRALGALADAAARLPSPVPDASPRKDRA